MDLQKMAEKSRKKQEVELEDCTVTNALKTWVFTVFGAVAGIPIGIKAQSVVPLVFLVTTGTVLDVFKGLSDCERKHAEHRAQLLLEQQNAATELIKPEQNATVETQKSDKEQNAATETQKSDKAQNAATERISKEQNAATERISKEQNAAMELIKKARNAAVEARRSAKEQNAATETRNSEKEQNAAVETKKGESTASFYL